MKQFMLCVICFLILSCDKQHPIFIKNDFAGTWELAKKYDQVIIYREFAPGNGMLLKLMKNGEYERQDSTGQITSGVYSINMKGDCISGEKVPVISFDRDENDIRFIEVSNDELSIKSGYCYPDGSYFVYRKIED